MKIMKSEIDQLIQEELSELNPLKFSSSSMLLEEEAEAAGGVDDKSCKILALKLCKDYKIFVDDSKYCKWLYLDMIEVNEMAPNQCAHFLETEEEYQKIFKHFEDQGDKIRAKIDDDPNASITPDAKTSLTPAQYFDPKDEKKFTKAFGSTKLNIVLDVLGLGWIPLPFGSHKVIAPLADTLNAILYYRQKEWLLMFLSMVAAMPGASRAMESHSINLRMRRHAIKAAGGMKSLMKKALGKAFGSVDEAAEVLMKQSQGAADAAIKALMKGQALPAAVRAGKFGAIAPEAVQVLSVAEQTLLANKRIIDILEQFLEIVLKGKAKIDKEVIMKLTAELVGKLIPMIKLALPKADLSNWIKLRDVIIFSFARVPMLGENVEQIWEMLGNDWEAIDAWFKESDEKLAAQAGTKADWWGRDTLQDILKMCNKILLLLSSRMSLEDTESYKKLDAMLNKHINMLPPDVKAALKKNSSRGGTQTGKVQEGQMTITKGRVKQIIKEELARSQVGEEPEGQGHDTSEMVELWGGFMDLMEIPELDNLTTDDPIVNLFHDIMNEMEMLRDDRSSNNDYIKKIYTDMDTLSDQLDDPANGYETHVEGRSVQDWLSIFNKWLEEESNRSFDISDSDRHGGPASDYAEFR